LKKIVYILVVILLFLQSGGMLMFYKIERQVQQNRMRQKMEDNNYQLQQFSISKLEFTRNKLSGNEIVMHGKLYDMKSFSIHGNTVDVLAMRDKAEELIIKAIKNAIKTSARMENGLLVRIVKLLTLDYSVPNLLQVPIAFYLNLQKLISDYNELINSRIPDILTPPPRFA
jgi:hypothetical protein